MATHVTDENNGARQRLLVPFALGHCANDLPFAGLYLIIPAFGAMAGLSPVEIGLLFTIHSFGSAIAYLPAGIITDHVANRGVLLLATFFWVGLGYFGASFTSDYWTFALLITLAGAGDAAWHPIATGVLSGYYKNRKAYALGMHALGGHMAEVLGLILAGYLLSFGDWRFALQVISLPALLMGLAFFFILPRIPRIAAARPTQADFSDIWKTWTTGSGLRVVALFTFYNMALFAMLTMTPVFLQSSHDFDWQETALILAVMMVFGAIAQPKMGKISDTTGRRSLLVAGNGVAAVAAFAAWYSSSLIVTLVALGVALTLLVAIRAVVLAVAIDHAGGREGTSLGLAFAFMDGLGATAAVIAGFVGQHDLSNAFLLASAFSVFAMYLALQGTRSQ